MYAYIKGVLEHKHNEYIVVEANGVGYMIYTPLSTLEALGAQGQQVKVYTHLHVREDVMNLYGFSSQEELNLFELLISVSGVGPKAALAVLSTVSPSRFGLAVITDDVKTLTKIPGIGNKTAQRIILELKDKLKKEQISSIEQLQKETPLVSEQSRVSEAISALMVLGYTAVEASRAVSAVYSEDMELESVIKGALKNLMR